MLRITPGCLNTPTPAPLLNIRHPPHLPLPPSYRAAPRPSQKGAAPPCPRPASPPANSCSAAFPADDSDLRGPPAGVSSY